MRGKKEIPAIASAFPVMTRYFRKCPILAIPATYTFQSNIPTHRKKDIAIQTIVTLLK
jgi:hypothetical protein